MHDLDGFLKSRELLRTQVKRIAIEMKPARIIERGAPPDRQLLDMCLSSLQVTMNAMRVMMDEFIALSAPHLLQPRDNALVCAVCEATVQPADVETHVCKPKVN